MNRNLYIYTNKYQKKLMQDIQNHRLLYIMDKINEVTYKRLQLELALYGYVDMKEFIKEFPVV